MEIKRGGRDLGEGQRGKYPLESEAALAASLLADRRSDQPEFAPEELDSAGPDALPLSDTTTIRQGAQAITGKAVWSAGQMGNRSEGIALYERERKKAAERMDREMERLAAWNARMTMVGGVQMTNGEAQDARQRVADNDDVYADRAVAAGQITADQREDFKRGIRRKIELEDRRGRGVLSEAEAREAEALDRSRIGQAIDAATADNHREFGQAHEANATRPDANAALRRGAGGDPVALYESALFQAANPPAKPPLGADAAQPAVASRIKATGLDL